MLMWRGWTGGGGGGSWILQFSRSIRRIYAVESIRLGKVHPARVESRHECAVHRQVYMRRVIIIHAARMQRGGGGRLGNQTQIWNIILTRRASEAPVCFFFHPLSLSIPFWFSCSLFALDALAGLCNFALASARSSSALAQQCAAL